MIFSRRLLWIFLGALTLFRLIYIGHFELSPDEAYYYQWSQRLDISYYSKGPGIALAVWLGTHVLGPTEWGVRLLAPFLALGTSLLLFALARRLYTESIAIWTVLTVNLIPIFCVGGLLMTIDPLSIFFWMAAVYTTWCALDRAPAWSLWWPATGALIGAGFLCKWTNAMLLVSILALLVSMPRLRQELLRPSFWSLLGVFAVFTIPPILWNLEHDWITVSHLTARGGLQRAFRFNPLEPLTFLGAHFAVYSPLIFGGLIAALPWGVDRARAHFKPRFLLAFTLPLFVLYFSLSLNEAGEANWTAPAMLTLGILAGAFWHHLAQGDEKEPGKPWARRFVLAALALGALASVLVHDPDLLRRAGIPLSYRADPGARLRGWRTVAEQVERFRTQFEADPARADRPKTFLIANSYGTASALSFYLRDKRTEAPGHPPVYIPESPAMENQYSFWPRYDGVVHFREIAAEALADPALTPDLKAAIKAALKGLPADEGSTSFEAAESWRTLVRHLRVARPALPLDESYVEQHSVSLFSGRDALYITDRTEERAPSTIKGGFERVEMVACIDLARHGLPLRQIRIFACYQYRGLSL